MELGRQGKRDCIKKEMVGVFVGLFLATGVGLSFAQTALKSPVKTAVSLVELSVAPVKIMDIQIRELDESSQLVIKSEGPLKYTLTKSVQNKQVTLHLAKASLSVPDAEVTGTSMISKVQTIEIKNPLEVQVVIQMAQAVSYEIFQQENVLYFSVKKDKKAKEDAGYETPLPSTQDRISLYEAGKRLERLISLDVVDGDAAGVFRSIAEEAGLGLAVFKDLKKETLSLRVNRVSVKEALALACARIPGYGFDVQYGVISVGLLTDLDSQKKMLPQYAEIHTVHNREVSEGLIKEITALAPGGVLTVDTTTNTLTIKATEYDLQKIKQAMKSLCLAIAPLGGRATSGSASELVTKIFPVNMSATNDTAGNNTPNLERIAGVIRQTVLSKGGLASVILDPRTNSLVVTDTQNNMSKIERLIEEMDVSLSQVMIEAMLVEVNIDKVHKLGVNWNFSNNTSSTPTRVNMSTFIPSVFGGDITFGSFQNSGTLSTILQALETNGTANILSTPKLMAVNRTTAQFILKDSMTFLESSVDVVSNAGITTTQKFGVLDIPIILTIRPEIGKDNKSVTLNPLSIQVTSVTDIAKQFGPPPTNQRSAANIVMAKDGETIVIGGMIKELERKKETKVPILGDLPLLGFLFKGTAIEKQKVELLVFLTPHVVKN